MGEMRLGAEEIGKIYLGNKLIVGGGIQVSYEDGFFNDNGSVCIIINNSQEAKSFEVHNRIADITPNSIAFLYGYSDWSIITKNDIIYDYRLGDGDNVEANESIQGKAGVKLFSLSAYGSYLVLKIIS